MMLRSDLKLRLTLRIAAVAALCFAAASAWLLFDADRAARGRIARVADLAARELELQQGKLEWIKVDPATFPDLQTVAATAMEPGLCIAYRTAAGDTLQRFCGGTAINKTAPELFALLYRSLFDPARAAARPVLARGQVIGEAVAALDPATLIAEVWHDLSRLLGVMLATLFLLCLLVYAALARALRPTRLIRAGLERIAAKDLSARLPPFDLAELSAVRDVFNQLAEALQQTMAEREALTHRLIAVQDEERKRLARELHDEFGQNLTAIRALAASAGQTAAQHCPALLAECESIARTSTVMMETLRGTLFRLRPPDVEELGLAASLEGLIAGWNGCSGGRTRFEIRLHGDFEHIPVTLGAGLYRIAQEAITNAAKHADARRVTLSLTTRPSEVVLSVEDDGRANADDLPAGSGLGLLGMRERASMLGGRLSFASKRGEGSILRAVIPRVEPDYVEHAA
jgi:signal transduction histidine kinase